MIPFAGIWESITGKELLTGNVLSKDERITQGIIGTIDFVSLGICGYIAKSAKAVAKIFGINFLSNAAATTVSYVGDEVGFPKPVTLVLSVAVDGIFSVVLGKHLIKPGVGSANGGGTSTLSGHWQAINESMSDFSRAYQKQITGQEGMAWVQNGVRFDGIKDGVLLDAKGKYAQFIDKSTGEFYEWFSGKDSLIAEARRQINASEGAKIQWYFAEEESLNVVQDLFMEKGIVEIELIYEAPN